MALLWFIYARDREIEPGPQCRHGRDGGVDARARARLSEAPAAARPGSCGAGSRSFRSPTGPISCSRRVTLAAGICSRSSSSAEWLAREKLAAVPFLLAVIPFYNFLGLKWDQNSILIPLWALAMWAMLRALATRHLGWAALAGLAAAAAMLTKYWSVFLLAALAFTALADRRRGAYFRSAAPWVTAGVFIAAVAPHAWWLMRRELSADHLGDVAALRAVDLRSAALVRRLCRRHRRLCGRRAAARAGLHQADARRDRRQLVSAR